jgi:hypothetical protein
MNAEGGGIVQQLVIVRAEGPDRFTAQAVGIPEVKEVASTEAGAISQLRRSLAAWLATAKLVRVEVPVNGTGNPWLDGFGRSANDPEFAAFLEELQGARSGLILEDWSGP